MARFLGFLDFECLTTLKPNRLNYTFPIRITSAKIPEAVTAAPAPAPLINNEDFFKSLIQHASHFENLLAEAQQKNSRLKFVASFENGKASVGLQFIPSDSPFYNLENYKSR